MMLGRIYGSVTTKEFNFSAEARIKKLQYVAVKDFEGKWILAYIDFITKYPNRTMGKAKVIGYRDSRGFLKPLPVPFEPDTPVYTADDDIIKNTLGLKDEGLYFGILEGHRIHVNLPVRHLMTKHAAILAKSGAGKSYAAGVLLEELAEAGLPVVVIDPHGEYRTLVEENKKAEEVSQMWRFGVRPKSYREKIRIFDAGQQNPVKLDAKLTADEILEMLPAKISSSQAGLLYTAIRKISGKDYTLKNIISEVNLIESGYRRNLISMLESLEDTKLFSANPTRAADLVESGKITVIDMKEASPEMQQIIVLKLAKELFEARKHGRIPEFFLVVEEAHNFCPERGFGEVASSKILRVIASEGRKFGLGLCIISQRPAKVDKNVLSQCSTQIILKVTNPNDIRAIMDSVEGIEFGVKEEIKDLPVGIAMVVGVTEQPLIVDIRIRKSQHGGELIETKERKEAYEGAEPSLESVIYEGRILLFTPRFFEEDVKRIFKGIGDIRFLNYPMWKAVGVWKGEDIEFFVDGLTGEVALEKNGTIEYSKGIRPLLELPAVQRNILLYLMKNRQASVESISGDLKILLSETKTELRSLVQRKFVSYGEDGFRPVADFDLPPDPSFLAITHRLIEKEREGETIDFAVSANFVKKIGEIWGMRVLEVKPVYYPYWLISRKNTRYLIDGLNNRAEIEKSKLVRSLI